MHSHYLAIDIWIPSTCTWTKCSKTNISELRAVDIGQFLFAYQAVLAGSAKTKGSNVHGVMSTMIASVFLTLFFSSILLTVSSEDEWDYYKHMINASLETPTTFLQPDLQSITFDLYTRQNPIKAAVITMNNVKSVQASHWNMTIPTVMVIHGWMSNGTDEMPTIIRDAFLQDMDINVIAVNWGTIAEDVVYGAVVYAVPYVADHVGAFCEFLRTNVGLHYSNFKIIGHSLGAHVAGLAAQSVKSNGLVAELVGLDPAKPLYELAGPSERIDRSQAKYVEIVHTCAGLLGLARPLGISDFYANDGRNQPGCGVDVLGACAHQRSYLYFAESIKHPKGFPSKSDDDGSTAYMGGATLDEQARNSYHFKTGDKPPYTISN